MSKSKLTKEDRRAIVKKRKSGISASIIAASYKISERTVRKIVQEAREAQEKKALAKRFVSVEEPETKEAVEKAPVTPEPVSKPIYHWVVTSNIISIAVSGESPVIYAKGHNNFEKARLEIINDNPEEAIRLLNTEKLITEKFDFVTIKNGKVFYKGMHIDNSLTKRIVESVTCGDKSSSLVNFFEKLMLNPDQNAVQGLFDFLRHNDIEIIESGDFIAFKRVRDDYRDFYSGKFDNSVGTTVSMERSDVNADPNITCSRGLHVAAKDYLPHYYNGRGRIVTCQVNPMNVVSVPSDYDGSKMRVCEYEVIEDITEQFDK